MDWMSFVDGGDGEGLTLVQDPIPRPAPIPRPGATIPQARQPAQPRAQAAPRDWYGELEGQTQTPAQAPSQPQQSAVASEPDAPTWTGRVVQSIRGKQDPRYSDIPTIAEVTINEGINRPMSESAAWLAGTSDKGMVGTYRDMLGDRFLGTEQDANGYPLIVYRGKDGQPQRAYVNKPGLDMQDVVRGGMGVAPFVGAGRAVGAGLKGIEAGLGFRTLAQGVTQAGTSVAQDVGNMLMGGDNPDIREVGKKATAVGLFGAGGEIAGAAIPALWRRFVTEPGLFDRSTGQLTQKGSLAASEVGLDPSALTSELRQQFARELARTGSADTAARGVTNAEFGIAKTRGELSGDMPTLLREQHIRGGNYGEQAAGMMENFDRNQRKQVSDAILGEIATSSGTAKPGIARRLAPGRTSADYSKAEIGSAIRQNTEDAFQTAKAAEREAWDGVKDLRPTEEAMPLLKQRLNEAIGEFPIPQGMKAEMMEKELDSFLKGQAPAKASEWREANPIGNIDQMRKRLSRIQRGATDPTDREAAGALMEGFNNWIRDAAEQSLLKGDPQSAANMVIARGLTRELHQVFDGPQGSPAARILSDVLKKADSAEGVVNALFTGPTAQTKGGTVAALKNLKTAYDKYLEPEAAKAAWDDIRLAYFLRMVQSKGGEAVGVQQLQSNIKQALATQQSVSQLLYAPEEIAMLQRFLRATAGIERKNPNKPWSGVAAGGIIKDMVGSLISAFGFKSVVAKAGLNMAGGQIMKKAYGPAAAANATSGTVPALPSPSFAGYGGAYGARSQDQ